MDVTGTAIRFVPIALSAWASRTVHSKQWFLTDLPKVSTAGMDYILGLVKPRGPSQDQRRDPELKT
eukprot:4319261-Prorocentrum_lima.AAC.1